MSDSPPNKVEQMAQHVAEKAIEKVVVPAVQEAPSVPPSADKSGISTVVAAANAVQAGLQAQKGKEPAYQPLPAYALQYAPLLWLNKKEQFWPGSPIKHLANCTPRHKAGDAVDVPQDELGKWPSLELPAVNDEAVYLSLNEDPRVNDHIEKLMATAGTPDPVTRRSDAPCWIVQVDKSQIVEPGTVDIFYFYFYPYNLGNSVLFTNYGNHVGDWEHNMIRFKDGKPIAMHYSAHSEGHSFPWTILEKMGDRPVGYVASGSHANYPKAGDKNYAGVPIFGPIDHAKKGILWDPSLNYVAAKFDIPTGTFTPLRAPPPTETTTAAPPTPGDAPTSSSHPGAGSATPASTPTYDTRVTPEEIIAVLDFKGKWGDSFNDIRQSKGIIGDSLVDIFTPRKKGEEQQPKHSRSGSTSSAVGPLGQKLLELQWSEGPTGPRYKSLERVGMQWNTTVLSTKLV